MPGPTSSFRCTYLGCTEVGFVEFANRTDQRQNAVRYRDTWRCVRHNQPDDVLSAATPTRTRVVVASRSTKYDLPNDLFWFKEGTEFGSGFIYGPGFKAFANDFPEGTRLTVTATVEIPESPDEAA